MTEEQLKTELDRAYRALRGIYGKIVNGEMPDDTMLGYHSPAIAASIRYVSEGSLDGSEYFIGKPVKVLHDTLKSAIRKPTP